MKKVYVSLALVGAMAASASAVEVTPFGHLGAFYHQGFGGLGVQNNGKEVQRAYANVSARVGVEVGLGSAFSIGLGAWGGYPFYATGDSPQNVGDIAFPRNVDVSDAYLRYDGRRLRVIGGRFDIGEFYMGKDRKNYTGVDWIYGNTQGAALNVDGGAVSLWAYWRNSQLGAGQAFNRIGYELSSFDTYQGQKNHQGELVSGGVDVNFGAFRISPFASYLTSTDTRANSGGIDVLNAGAKAQLELGDGGLKSITTLRGIFSTTNLVKDGSGNSGTTFWLDEELRFSEIWKLGAGYITSSKDTFLLNYGDRARFYGYRAGLLCGAGVGNSLGINNNASTWYVFGGLEAKRIALDLLYAGGNYKEISAIVAFKLWESGQMHFSVGGGYVGTGYGSNDDTTLGSALTGITDGTKWQDSAYVFAKLGF
ncbi:hypothetical protein V3I05_10410 [Helicobacter mastomyrinus]|uniref:Outer membrane protein n=1 Tax=Helicobacter mastomyrinus TaxID=287948 RepID=A0ABZ3F7B4_9HELI